MQSLTVSKRTLSHKIWRGKVIKISYLGPSREFQTHRNASERTTLRRVASLKASRPVSQDHRRIQVGNDLR